MKINNLTTAKAVFIASLAFSATAVLAERPSGTPTCSFKGGAYYSSNHTLYLESYADTSAEVVFNQTTVSCLNQNNPSGMDVVIQRDTPLKANSTVVLPFAALRNDDCIKLYEVSNFEKRNGTWEAQGNLKDKDISQNQPYLMVVKTDSSGCEDRMEVHFKSNTSQFAFTPDGQDFTAYSNTFRLRGTLKYKKWNTGDAGIEKVYGYAAKNKNGASGGQFVKIGGGAYLPPLRAYLEYQGQGLAKKSSDNIEDFELPETIEVRLMDGDSTLSIGKLNPVTGEIQMDSRRFDLNGRAINGKPANHGVYVGKQKVVR